MILSDQHIREAIHQGTIKVKPELDYGVQLGSCSVDFRLGNVFQVFDYSRHAYIDLRSDRPINEYMREIRLADDEPFIMQPRAFVLASTLEWIELADDIAGRLEGRSSLGRLGIIVHSTAALFEPGWAGNIVVELGNLGVMPVALYAGMRICTMTFEQVSSKVSMPYRAKPGNKYAGQTGPIASRIYQDSDLSR